MLPKAEPGRSGKHKKIMKYILNYATVWKKKLNDSNGAGKQKLRHKK